MSELLTPVTEAVVTVVVVAAGFFAGAVVLLSTADTRRRWAVERSGWPARETPGLPAPTDAAIEARVARMAALRTLPPGWSPRDAARLLRVHARRTRFAE